jgi:NAD binding domain of 6-phosphogluconate dehydrogenase
MHVLRHAARPAPCNVVSCLGVQLPSTEACRQAWCQGLIDFGSNCSRTSVGSMSMMSTLRRVKSVEGLAEDCSIMFAMLADDAAVRDVFVAVLRGEPPPGAIFADMSTVLPSTTAELAAAAADKGALIAGSESKVQLQMDGRRWTSHEH